jgi:hypothetical protein
MSDQEISMNPKKNFFQKINFLNFLKSEKSSKFFLEMLSIFIAVTLAFGLSKWNENRNNANLEIKLLKEIYYGLEADSIDLAGNKLGHEMGLNVIKNIIPLLKKDTTFSINFYIDFNYIFRTFLSIQNTSGYESLKAVGLDKVTNDTLLNQMVKLYEIDYEMVQKVEENYAENKFKELYYNRIMDIVMPHTTAVKDSLVFKNLNRLDPVDLMRLKVYLSGIGSARSFNISIYEDTLKKLKSVKDNVKKELITKGLKV